MQLKKSAFIFIVLLCSLSLIACQKEAPIPEGEAPLQDTKQNEESELELALKNKNKQLEQDQVSLTRYATEVNATLIQPTESNFAVNERVTIEGHVENHEQLKSGYVWVKIYFNGKSDTDQTQHHYIPLENGHFKQEIGLANGEGEYNITILLPSQDQDNYYYDIALFDIYNISPTIYREISYSSFAQDAGLTIQTPESGYVTESEVFNLTGYINQVQDEDTIMIQLLKDGETWKHMLPVKDGMFTYQVPLFYGKGVHELKVYVPDMEQDNYYQEGTSLYIDNQSELTSEPIQFMTTYVDRGVNLEFPYRSGDEAELTYSVKGSLDKEAPFAEETTHLYITTKKGDDEALEVIPVTDYTFDDEFYLRFGPGTYDVTVSVPEIKEENSDTFYYQHVAQFSVTNTANEDQRDLLPSRGVQSDAPEIQAIANELMTDTMSERDKAKAVYEYTAKNIAYDVNKLVNNGFNWDDSALKTLQLGTGVCQDYAYLALAILRAGGMEARYIAGTAGSGFNFARHAWVEVNVDGEWLTMDPTWGAGYVSEDDFVPRYTEDYFEPNEEAFKTHTRTGVEY